MLKSLRDDTLIYTAKSTQFKQVNHQKNSLLIVTDVSEIHFTLCTGLDKPVYIGNLHILWWISIALLLFFCVITMILIYAIHSQRQFTKRFAGQIAEANGGNVNQGVSIKSIKSVSFESILSPQCRKAVQQPSTSPKNASILTSPARYRTRGYTSTMTTDISEVFEIPTPKIDTNETFLNLPTAESEQTNVQNGKQYPQTMHPSPIIQSYLMQHPSYNFSECSAALQRQVQEDLNRILYQKQTKGQTEQVSMSNHINACV